MGSQVTTMSGMFKFSHPPLWWACAEGHVLPQLLIADKEKERESLLAKKIKKLQGVKEGIKSIQLEIEENKMMKGKLEKQLTKQEKLKNKLEVKIKVLETEIRADVNQVAPDGRTPLWWACKRGHVEVVAQLLAVPGINANRATQDGCTP